MIHPVPLSVFSDIVTAIFGFLFILFLITVGFVIVLGLLVLKALPFIIGFVGGFLAILAEADDTDIDQTTGYSSQNKSSVSAEFDSNASESAHARSETVGSGSRKGAYETNEYGELVEKK